ncbi:hypothetical protein PAMA_017776 [Pampus argenteus]
MVTGTVNTVLLLLCIGLVLIQLLLCFSQKICNPLYRTSNQVYGSRRPTVHEMPTSFKGTTCQFSELMLHSGMYQDHGFNTSVERSQVTAAMATLNKRVKLRKAN